MTEEEDEKKKEEEAKLKAEEEAKKKAEEEQKEKEGLDIVKDAKEAAATMKEQTDKREKLIEREEKLLDRKEALNALGGGSPAGDRPSNKEETPHEYRLRVEKEMAEGKFDDRK